MHSNNHRVYQFSPERRRDGKKSAVKLHTNFAAFSKISGWGGVLRQQSWSMLSDTWERSEFFAQCKGEESAQSSRRNKWARSRSLFSCRYLKQIPLDFSVWNRCMRNIWAYHSLPLKCYSRIPPTHEIICNILFPFFFKYNKKLRITNKKFHL